MPKKKHEWVKIKDRKVRHVWICDKCKEEVKVDPAFYVDSGEPMCSECDEQMSYSHTEIRQ